MSDTNVIVESLERGLLYPELVSYTDKTIGEAIDLLAKDNVTTDSEDELDEYCEITSRIYDELDDIIILGVCKELLELGIVNISHKYIEEGIKNSNINDDNARISDFKEIANQIWVNWKKDNDIGEE